MKKYNKIMLFRPKPPVLERVDFPRNPRLPIELAYANICLKKYGYSPFIIDCYVNPSLDSFKKAKDSDIIIISCTDFDMDYVLKFSEDLKRSNKDKIIIVIGQQATYKPHKFMYFRSPIDFVLLGEIEESIIELIESLNKGLSISLIKGVYSNKFKSKEIRITKNPDKLPFLEYLKGYDYIYPVKVNQKVLWGHILSIRGCPYPCSFCSQMSRKTFGSKLRMRSGKNIVLELDYLKNKGINVVLFDDDNFTSNKKFVLDVCKSLQNRDVLINWVIHARIDELDEETVSEMKKAGCILLRLGIESGSNKIINVLKKRYIPIDWVSQTRKAVSLANNAGIPVLGLFMIGNPGETEEDALSSIKLSRELDMDLIQLHFFAPYSDTPLYNLYKGKIKKETVYHHACQDIQTSEIPNERLKRIYRSFFYGFYLRPSFLIKHLWKYRNFYISNTQLYRKLFDILFKRWI